MEYFNCYSKKVGIEVMETEGVDKKIEKFERNFNVILPDDYKEFLLKYNGGSTYKLYFEVKENISDFKGNQIKIENFLSFNKIIKVRHGEFSEIEYENISKKDEQKSEFEIIRPYKNLIMIGWVSGSYSLLISCEEEDYGTIYLQDDREREYFYIEKITCTFKELISNLKKDNIKYPNLSLKRKLKRAKSEKEKNRILEDFEVKENEKIKVAYRELKI